MKGQSGSGQRPRGRDVKQHADVALLVEAKLAAPQPRADTIARPRLSAALDAGEAAPVTLVSAPAGYGKTTAVRAWCAARDISPAWVTLDAGDNDPTRLWTHVATAIDRLHPGVGREALARLNRVGGSVEDGIDALMNGIGVRGTGVVVVLDEADTATDAECLATIDHALSRLPPTVRLILISRSDPILALSRLRGRGTLLEVRADDLAFTLPEAHRLLVERTELELDPDEVSVLWRRTEGWPAALVFACSWLRSVPDPAGAVRAFGGSHRFVVDYLTDEVLGSVDDEARSFLLSASVLRRFTPELCDGVLERSDSAAVLAKLERTNMFISRLEHGGWFRVHSLFAEFAGSQLESREPGARAAIHGRAAAWLRGNGLLVEATEHAAAAGDHEAVAQILAENHLTWLRAGRARSLLRWVSTLPGEKLVEHPALAGAAATAALIIGRSTLLQRRYLRLVDRARTQHPERVDPYVEATVEMVRAASLEGGVGKAVAAGRRAVELAESEADEALVAALAGLARALFFAGELDEAWATALRAVEHPQAESRPGGQAVARVTLTLVALERQRLRAARTHAEKARALVGGIGSSRSWIGANASLALGVVLAEEGALAAAERELAYAAHFLQDEVATVHHAWLLAVLAGIRCRRGRLDEATTALRSAREEIAELADPGKVAMVIADVERELGEAASRASAGELLEPPTPAELAVLRLLVSDLTVREIGRTLFLSPNTIRSHTRALYRKLGASSRAEAVARAEALGLIEETESPM